MFLRRADRQQRLRYVHERLVLFEPDSIVLKIAERSAIRIIVDTFLHVGVCAVDKLQECLCVYFHAGP